MKNERISYKRIDKLARNLNKEVSRIQLLGDRADYYYHYKVDGIEFKSTKEVYNYLIEYANNEIFKNDDEEVENMYCDTYGSCVGYTCSNYNNCK